MSIVEVSEEELKPYTTGGITALMKLIGLFLGFVLAVVTFMNASKSKAAKEQKKITVKAKSNDDVVE